DGPEAAHIGQHIPSAPLIRSPSCFAGGEVRLGLCSDYNRAVVLMAIFIVLSASVAIVLVIASTADIGQAENRSLHGRFVRQNPGFTPVVRGCCVSSSVGSQIAAANDPIP